MQRKVNENKSSMALKRRWKPEQRREEKHNGKPQNTPMHDDLKWEKWLEPCEIRKADGEASFSLQSISSRTLWLFTFLFPCEVYSCSISGSNNYKLLQLSQPREQIMSCLLSLKIMCLLQHKSICQTTHSKPVDLSEVGESSSHRFIFYLSDVSSFCLIIVTKQGRLLWTTPCIRVHLYTTRFGK